MPAEDLRSDERKAIDASIASAVTSERERCAKVAEDWLRDCGDIEPETTSQEWARDAVRDITDAIRKPAL